MTMTGAGWAMHGIPGDITLGLTCAVLAVFYVAMIYAGFVIAASDTPAPEPDAEVPCAAGRSPAPTAATKAS